MAGRTHALRWLSEIAGSGRVNEPAPRTGFRPLRVAEKRRETDRVTSFFLEPVEADGWRDYLAGQFLSFRLPSTDARGKMLRNYSLASSPADTGHYQVCVKRESAATSAHGGQGSGYFHDHVQAGDILYADGPRGNFILRDNANPAMLISGDIGITPIMSMLRVLAEKKHRLTFIHECDNADAHIMRGEIAALIARAPQAAHHTFYRDDGSLLDATTLAPFLTAAQQQVYLCGPTPFMKRAYAALRACGVPPQHIAHEFFGPLLDLERHWQSETAKPLAPM